MSSSYPAASGGGGGGSGITALTGDVTAGPGSGSQAATVVAGHFGGTDGQFLKRASGLWGPASLALTDLPAGGATSNQILAWNGTNWVPADLPAGYVTAAMLHAGAAASNLGAFSGDISGTPPAGTVTGIQGRAVAATAPSTNQFYRWSGTSWVPSDLPAGYVTASMLAAGAAASNLGAFSGDLSGTPPAATVTGIQGKAVTAAPSVADQVLQYDGTNLVPVLLARLERTDGYLELSAGAHLRQHSTATAPTVATTNTGCTVSLATGSTDMVGEIQLVVGATTISAGVTWFTLTFGTAYTNNPFILIAEPGTGVYGVTTQWPGRCKVAPLGAASFGIQNGSASGTNATFGIVYFCLGFV